MGKRLARRELFQEIKLERDGGWPVSRGKYNSSVFFHSAGCPASRGFRDAGVFLKKRNPPGAFPQSAWAQSLSCMYSPVMAKCSTWNTVEIFRAQLARTGQRARPYARAAILPP